VACSDVPRGTLGDELLFEPPEFESLPEFEPLLEFEPPPEFSELLLGPVSCSVSAGLGGRGGDTGA
jgi:hypothetical protein